MAVQLVLPDPIALPEAVLFHREHPADPVLVLQVPGPGADDAETYVVRLDREEHRAWVNGLKESQRLQDLLRMEMHVLYEPATGYMKALPDLDKPTPFKQTFDTARAEAHRGEQMRTFLERRDRRVYPQSRFRTQLSGKQPFPRGR